MTIEQALRWSQTLIPSATLDAEVLLSFILNKPKEYLYIYPKRKITNKQYIKYKSLIVKRAHGIPLAYLRHYKEFFNLDFYVNKFVLIPEPETELIIEEILKLNIYQKKIIIADIATGSGCIAITLANHIPKSKIYAVDISKNALKIAQKNAKKHGVEKKIIFLLGNLLDPLPEKVNIIIANLPYIPTKIAKKIKNKPLISINGGKDGLKYFKILLKNAPQYLKKDGKIFLEMDPSQKIKIKKLAKKYFPGAKIKIKKDLSGKDRLLIVSLSPIA